MTTATTALTNALRHRERRAREAEDVAGATLLDASRTRSTMWYVALEEAEPAAALREVVDVVGHLLSELVHLIDELRDDEPADQTDHSRHAERREGDGVATSRVCRAPGASRRPG